MVKNPRTNIADRFELSEQCFWFTRGLTPADLGLAYDRDGEVAEHMPHLRAGTRCVRGNYRAENEDKCYADAAQGLFLVSDGMGGHEGGAEASRIVVEVIPKHLSSVLANTELDLDQLQPALLDAVAATREKMVAYAAEHPRCDRMGATIAVAVVRDHVAYVARVGDCRVYLVRGESVHRLTSDQTFAQELSNAGAITEEELKTSRFRHIVTNSLGVRPLQHEPKLTRIPLEPTDRLILLTDGATESLDDKAVLAAGKHGCPEEAADTLVLEALRHGSHDNISCVVVKVVPESVYWHEEV